MLRRCIVTSERRHTRHWLEQSGAKLVLAIRHDYLEEVGMPNDPKRKPPPAGSEPAEHHGSFAEGEAHPESYPDEDRVGTFAEGEADPASYPEEEHVGTFADGEADPASYAEEEHEGRFAEGEETLDRSVHQVDPTEGEETPEDWPYSRKPASG